MAAREQTPTGPERPDPDASPRRPPIARRHAHCRWYERYGGDRDYLPTLWTAWADGTPVTLPDPWGLQGDEARYHSDTHAVLCRVGGRITTVYDTVGEDAHPVVREAIEQQLDVELPTQEASR